ncbi:fumarylacetoacetate hydrolase family protein [Bartonella raoultii]|uniref:Fumarylacetoacetate hydrolase family protein n=1 Tax=Bartonella raoultii TaxID=1457020 RepID=A0ABS7I4R6_9HYPH|nr:fumarylacetoacetate hydrolase family protein [Bartonella raoultii]MBX4335809.1 fumarylacetoacetate hydrolase family protein [Bartonella raoultii]
MINNIYCVGLNYIKHIHELGNVVEDEPVIFSKPNSSLILGNKIYLPVFSKEIHFETEIVLKISKDTFMVDEIEAQKCYDALAVGLDLTARDLQTKLKEKKLPWLLSKGFKGAAYVSNFINKEKINNPITFEMKLNGKTVQLGNTKDMIFSFEKIISFLSRYIQLKSGDIIYTGTPQGVGKLSSFDNIELYLKDRLIAELEVQ